MMSDLLFVMHSEMNVPLKRRSAFPFVCPFSQESADRAKVVAEYATQIANVAKEEAVEARCRAEGLVTSIAEAKEVGLSAKSAADAASTKAAEAWEYCEQRGSELRELEVRVLRLEKENERLLAEATAVQALREAIDALDLNNQKLDREFLKILGSRVQQAEDGMQRLQSDTEAELKRLEASLGGQQQMESFRKELAREIERLNALLRDKAAASSLEPIQRDIDVARRKLAETDDRVSKLTKPKTDESILDRLRAALAEKADIDYVDEANDLAAAREARELNLLKKKFNDLLNFLATIPGIAGDAPPDLRPRGTKLQLACLSCDRGGSPPRDDIRGKDGNIYHAENKTAAATLPARLNVGTRSRPSSAPGKRQESSGRPSSPPAHAFPSPRTPSDVKPRMSTVHIVGPSKEAATARQRPVSAGVRRDFPNHVKASVITPKFS